MPRIDPQRFLDALAALIGRPITEELFALAVSGGPDSLAMLVLAHGAGLEIRVLTVDHGLRPEAAAEAEYVAAICAAREIPHETLKVFVDLDAASPQAAARASRYDAMADWCEAHGIRWLLTAHHADDQAETLLMRLSRGSGVSGMAGIRARRGIEGADIELLRPLLGVRKADLAEIVSVVGLTAVEDPSNDDDAFDRTAARRLLASGAVDAPRAAETAAHLADAETALAWTAETAWAGRAETSSGIVSLDAGGLPIELVRRLVLRAVIEINPAAEPHGPSLMRLIAGLAEGRAGNLAGVAAEPGAHWRFSAAAPRAAAKGITFDE